MITRNFSVAIDNHEPTRDFVHGVLVETLNDHDAIRIDDPNALGLKDWQRSNYLIDTGDAITVYYVAGWNEQPRDDAAPYVLLHPFPTNGGTRPDGRPVDYSTWMLGPRRTYHFKVS
jgi:hypothetical protein